jgi:hypothetical protein
LKIFNPPKEEEDNDQTLPQLPRTPTKPMEIEVQLESKWAKKFVENLSSPSKPKGMKLMKGTKQCLIHAQLHEQELTIVQAKRVEDLERKVTKRKVLQKSGGLTTDDAQRKIDALK